MKTLEIVPGTEARCPDCDRLLLNTWPGTRAENLPVYCRSCKRVVKVNIRKSEAKSP